MSQFNSIIMNDMNLSLNIETCREVLQNISLQLLCMNSRDSIFRAKLNFFFNSCLVFPVNKDLEGHLHTQVARIVYF